MASTQILQVVFPGYLARPHSKGVRFSRSYTQSIEGSKTQQTELLAEITMQTFESFPPEKLRIQHFFDVQERDNISVSLAVRQGKMLNRPSPYETFLSIAFLGTYSQSRKFVTTLILVCTLFLPDRPKGSERRKTPFPAGKERIRQVHKGLSQTVELRQDPPHNVNLFLCMLLTLKEVKTGKSIER